jgi:serine protease inhibitor
MPVSVRSRFGLAPALKSLGIAESFGPKADFSRLFEVPMQGIVMTAILHESWIDVNEKGVGISNSFA